MSIESAIKADVEAVGGKVLSEAERMFNLGETIVTKTLGKITVKELSLESLLGMSQSLVAILGEVQTLAAKLGPKADPFAWVSAVLTDPKLMDVLKSLAAAATGIDVSKFNNLPISDWVKIGTSLAHVTDFAEIQQLFQMILPTLQALKPSSP
jgi:hypothetical protein